MNGDDVSWVATVKAKLASALAAAADGTPFEWDPPLPIPDGALDSAQDPDVPPEPMRPGYPPMPWPAGTFEEIRRYAQIQILAEYAFAVEEMLAAQFESDFGVRPALTLTAQGAWREAEAEYERRVGGAS